MLNINNQIAYHRLKLIMLSINKFMDDLIEEEQNKQIQIENLQKNKNVINELYDIIHFYETNIIN